MNWAARAGVCLVAVALLPRPSRSQTMTYHARIVLEEGVPPPVTPQILPDPMGRRCTIVNFFGNGIVEYVADASLRSDECQVTIRLAGYRKIDTTLRDGAVIVMNHPGSHANPTVSLVTLEAPEAARKAYAKGISAIFGKKWEAARKELERAVGIYPDYAPAWNALGEALLRQSQPIQARAAFERSVKSDPRFINGWVQLAHLDVDEGRMEDAVGAADRAVRLDPTGYPAVYLSQARAELALLRLDDATRSALRVIELDTDHEIPRAEAVLASVLAAKGDREGAVTHWKKYLALAPKADDVAEVQKRIAEMEAGGVKTP